MKAGGKIILYLVGTVLLAALCSPCLYWFGHWFGETFRVRVLAETNFQRFFNRSILLSALVLFVPFLRWVGAESLKNLGLERNRRRLTDLFGGFATALALMVMFGFCVVNWGFYGWKTPLPWHSLPRIIGAALVAPVIEEILFRGAILGLFRQSTSARNAIVWSSALFSIVHFLKPADVDIGRVTWHSGWDLLPHVFWRFSEPLWLLAGFTTLFVLGLLLAHATVATRSLYLGVGIHAGLILGKMGFNKLAKRTGDFMPWFGPDLITGVGAVAILLFLWFSIWLFFLRARRHLLPLEHRS